MLRRARQPRRVLDAAAGLLAEDARRPMRRWRSPTACARANAWAAPPSATASPSRTAARNAFAGRARRVPAACAADRFRRRDGEPVDLVFAMAVPEHFTQQHLQLLSELAERFADADFRAALRDAPDMPQALRALLLDRPTPTPSARPRMNAAHQRRANCSTSSSERLGLRWVAGATRRGARAGIRWTPSRGGRRWPATSTSSIPTRCRSSAPRNWPGSTALDSRQRWETIEKIVQFRPLALVISKNQPCPEDLRDRRRGIRHAAVDLAQARPRTAQPPAVPPGAHAGAARHPARRVHGDLFDRRADHRRIRVGQERAGAGTDHARPSPGRRRRAGIHPDRARRARRHLPGTAAGPAGSARPGRAQHPRRCSATPR